MTSKGNIPPPPPPPPSVPPLTPTLKLKVNPGQDAPRNKSEGLPPIKSSVSIDDLDDPKDGWGKQPYLRQTKPGFVKRMRKFFLGKNKKKKKVRVEVN